MTDRNLLYFLCFLIFIGLIIVSVISPSYILGNDFLANFINHELLNVLAVTTSVTMAWSGHLVTVVASLENENDGLRFPRLRVTLRNNIILLGLYFVASIALLIVEAGIDGNPELRSSIYSVLILFLLMNLVVMIQTHMVSFGLPTKKQIKQMLEDQNTTEE